MANAQHSEKNFDRTKMGYFDAKRETCATCRFWLPEHNTIAGRGGPELGFGFCRRHAPKIIDALVPIVIGRPALGYHRDEVFDASEASDISAFPGAYANEWCGEFEWLPRLKPVEMPIC